MPRVRGLPSGTVTCPTLPNTGATSPAGSGKCSSARTEQSAQHTKPWTWLEAHLFFPFPLRMEPLRQNNTGASHLKPKNENGGESWVQCEETSSNQSKRKNHMHHPTTSPGERNRRRCHCTSTMRSSQTHWDPPRPAGMREQVGGRAPDSFCRVTSPQLSKCRRYKLLSPPSAYQYRRA